MNGDGFDDLIVGAPNSELSDTGAAGNAYNFRLTNSGSNTGFIYTLLPQAHDTVHEQVSYRWADENNAPRAASWSRKGEVSRS